MPPELGRTYVRRLLEEVVAPGGRLLVAEYRGRKDTSAGPWVDELLQQAGFAVESWASGFWEGKELTRIAIVAGSSDE